MRELIVVMVMLIMVCVVVILKAREYEMKEKSTKLLTTLKRFALLSLYSHEHSDSDNPDEKDWVRYEYLDHRQKLVIGSEEDYEDFKKYLKGTLVVSES